MERGTSQLITTKTLSEIINIRFLTESTYVVRFQRQRIEFQAGQYIVINPQGNKQKREYSIYSPVNAPYLEVLVKEVDEGFLSKRLKNSKPGDVLEIEGPFGYFILDETKVKERKYLFIASGTGISPFHSMILSNPGLNFKLLHGVRLGAEGYDRQDYPAGSYIQCTSKDEQGDFHGRVTEYMLHNPVDEDTWVYLCGNSVMIDDAYTILEQQNIPSHHLHTEVYF